MILAGDIGGTKTILALFESVGGTLESRSDETYRSADHDSLEEVVSLFLSERTDQRIDAACFGVAGAVVDGCAETTNLTWSRLDERNLLEVTGAGRLSLLNDLEAAAYGMLALGSRDRVILQRGATPHRDGNAAVIAAGTGLGEAILYWDGSVHRAIASEGGHVDFAPRTEREIELLRFLRDEHGGRVSNERVLCGPGLYNIYRFLRGSSGECEPSWLADRLCNEDSSSVIGEIGLRESEHPKADSVCAASLELFVSIYGAKAGDLALKCLATRVFVGGGIAPKILPALERPGFLEAFADKGRFRKLLSDVEVCVSLEPRVSLLGAARYAARNLG